MEKLEKFVEKKEKLYRIIKTTAFVLIIICAVKFITDCDRLTGDRTENTISFTGHGEVSAVPDIASIYFTISKDAKTVKEAQDSVAQIEKESLDFLRANKIADRDIKASNASFYPKYEYQYDRKICSDVNCPPPVGRSVIVGYIATESITVKIRNTDDTGKIMQGLGELGVSDLNGPNFAIDNEDGLKAEARKKAIDDSKSKAKVLAKDLGVRLGKITSFSESGNYPMPIYGKAMMALDAVAESVPAEIPKGENIITSDVTITYEIK
ncbi:SIMPL domain-containing protein [Patescibacteria group bacterium]|nr:SIMPL domain-containing protein [Patescibacteria group bacterium]